MIYLGIALIIIFILYVINNNFSSNYNPTIQSNNYSLTNSITNAKRLLRTEEPFQTIDIMIAGYSFGNRQSHIAGLHEFEKVILLPEPENEFDENAIKLLNQNNLEIGYIPSKNNRQVLAFLLGKFEYEAYIKKIILTKQDELLPVIIINFYKTEYSNLVSIKTKIKPRPIEKPYDASIKMHRLSFERCMQAMKLEKQGYFENAIEMYKSIINNYNLKHNNFYTSYHRLCIIYRNRKDYKSEIEIIKKWLVIVQKSNDLKEKEKLQKRLIQSEKLLSSLNRNTLLNQKKQYIK